VPLFLIVTNIPTDNSKCSIDTMADKPSGLVIQATQWSELSDVDVVQPFSSNDYECLKEIYGVLKKYGQHNRIGVALLHSHFHVDSNEFLLETTDVQERSQLIRPVRKNAFDGVEGKSIIATIVKLVEDGDRISMLDCVRCRYYSHHDKR
jgi:hypothetical protein